MHHTGTLDLHPESPPVERECGLPHRGMPATTLTGRGPEAETTYQAAPLLSPKTMTLLLPRTSRSVTPHTYVVPVVRELPTNNPAAGAPSSAW